MQLKYVPVGWLGVLSIYIYICKYYIYLLCLVWEYIVIVVVVHVVSLVSFIVIIIMLDWKLLLC